jgi:hypothetical protein
MDLAKMNRFNENIYRIWSYTSGSGGTQLAFLWADGTSTTDPNKE